jgi:hypothetical protein
MTDLTDNMRYTIQRAAQFLFVLSAREQIAAKVFERRYPDRHASIAERRNRAYAANRLALDLFKMIDKRPP